VRTPGDRSCWPYLGRCSSEAGDRR
jgi:hypothetical protein